MRPDLVLSWVFVRLVRHSDVVGLSGGYRNRLGVVHSVICIESVDLALTGVVEINSEVAAGVIGGDMLQGDRHRVRRGGDLVVVTRIVARRLRRIPAPPNNLQLYDIIK